MGQQRALDGLEELQRRARDQQRGEDVAGDGGVGAVEVGRQHAAVEQRLLGDHDAQHGDGEAAAAREAQLVVFGCLRSVAFGRRENAHGTTTSETNGAAAMPIATTFWPEASPIRTATANSSREVASMNTSAP